MQFIRKNYPVTTAWFAYLAFAWLLKILLLLGIFWVQNWLSPETDPSAFPFLGAVIFIAGEYISFIISVRWIAVPLSLIAKNITARPKLAFLILYWLSFGYFFVLFCLPLLLINAFPGFAFNGFPYFIPISKEVADIIGFAWKSIVSLFVYRSIIISYLSEEAERSSTSEYQATVS